MGGWNVKSINSREYTCGFCNCFVASNLGWNYYVSSVDPYDADLQLSSIYICPNCDNPTFFDGTKDDEQTPGVLAGNEVSDLPQEVHSLYTEIRKSYAVNAYTAAVMACRKLLMHIAVEKGAEKNKPFVYYVDYLEEKHFLPPDSKAWIDSIRAKGNEANHEVTIMSHEDAKSLIDLFEMMLKFLYEFPSRRLLHPTK